MKQIILPPRENWEQCCSRPAQNPEDLSKLVQSIFDDVTKNGDPAIEAYIRRYEYRIMPELRLTPEYIAIHAARTPAPLQAAIQLAAGNISCFHQSQREELHLIETAPGVSCWRESRPIERIGIYIPGGSAPLFSTVLMLAIPAQLAGCKEIIMCTPADKNGNIDPAILYAACLAGVSEVFAVGGIQAIAAMATGTGSIPRVDKIFGPGNQYVMAAKTYAQGLGVAIDLPAGPSELLIIADHTATPAFVAADLLSQAEHGADSQVTLLSTDKALIDATVAGLAVQLASLPRRDVALQALNFSQAILLPSLEDCFEFSNLYAPEHLIIATERAEMWVNRVSNAGSVFLGHYSCESAGDYASGTNHTLPTNGAARAYSGVSLDSFVKKITFQHITPQGIAHIGPAIALMADAEGLCAHKEAVNIRLKSINIS